MLAFADHYIVNQVGEVQEAESDANSKHWGRAELREGLHQPFFEVVAPARVWQSRVACFGGQPFGLRKLTPEVGPFDDVWSGFRISWLRAAVPPTSVLSD